MLSLYGISTVERGWRVEEKKPPGFLRVYHVQAGDVVYTDGVSARRLRHGFVYVFPSAAPYAMRQNPDDPLRCTFLHLELFPNAVARLVELPAHPDSLMGHLLGAIGQAIRDGQIRLLETLCDAFALYCREAGLFVPVPLPMDRVLRHIGENIGRTVPVDELAALTGYNAQYFIRLFRRMMGVTPHQYIIESRLRRAMLLLREPGSVAAVAEATGYRDLKTFCRAFRQRYGVTPSHFRRIFEPLP